MPLTQEIQHAAEALGQQLHADPGVQEYIRLRDEINQNTEVSALEKKLNSMYQDLVGRQQNGEDLQQSEVDAYYALKRQVEEYPLLMMRDSQLEGVKALFIETGKQLTSIMGMDFSKLAQ